jgi:hypothetical protein
MKCLGVCCREQQDIPKYVQQLLDGMKLAHQLTRTHVGVAQRRQKKLYDHKLHVNKFEKGDLVCKLNTSVKVGQSAKLKPIYVGPYIIVEVISPVLYKLEGNKKKMVLHHARLQPSSTDDVPLWIWMRVTNF